MSQHNDKQPPNRRDTPADAALDPLAEAEAVQRQLHEALARTARLLAALKQHKRQSRAAEATSSWRKQRPPSP
jgi:hypothetical protein